MDQKNGRKRVVMLLSNGYNPDDRVRNEAMALNAALYEVIILAWDRSLDKPEHEIKDGIVIQRTKLKTGYGQRIGKFFRYFRVWAQFLSQVYKYQPDVVHCHDFDTYFVGLLYKFLYPKNKLVLDAHENYYMMMKPLVHKAVSDSIAFFEKKFTKYADLVIGACDATANHYRNRGAKNVIVVGNWKDPSLYVFSTEHINKKRADIGADGHLVVTYIGSLTEDRNVIPLIRAVQERPQTFVIIGGTGGQETEIQKLCSSMPNAYYPGYIHPDEVPLLTSLSDVIYYGLDSADTYAPYNAPNKLFEALAAGKPIVASDLGGELTHIVQSERCGVLIPHIDSQSIGGILDKMKNSEFRMGLGINARRAGESTYNSQNSCEMLRKGYDRLWL